MAIKHETTVAGEVVQPTTGNVPVGTGTVGVESQVNGQATTVSGIASATGGTGSGRLIERDIDNLLYMHKSDDTPLMDLMLKAKKIEVNSSEVEHYMIDEPRPSVILSQKITADTPSDAPMTAILKLAAKDQKMIKPFDTAIIPSVQGWKEDGKTRTPSIPLEIFCTGVDKATQNPIVRTVNGPKSESSNQYSCMCTIEAGSKIIILGNALYETQKRVKPDSIVPKPTIVYLQKRGMNQIVSDYFESQRKRIPFAKATMAEAAITNFKVRGNRTLWAGVKGKFQIDTDEVGIQDVYFTEGVRYQFKREFQHNGKWTFEQLISLAKMFFTGEDVPKIAIALCGKNFLENIQCIDFSKHPEVQISLKTNSIGWEVTNVHTVFGDIEFKREPTLDRLGLSNSAGIFGEDRLVHYQRKAETSFNEDVEGEEAKRSGVLVFDALALKGTCHVWVDGEGTAAAAVDGKVIFTTHDGTEAPASPAKDQVFCLLSNCPGINNNALQGQMWQYTGSGWKEYEGEIKAISEN